MMDSSFQASNYQESSGENNLTNLFQIESHQQFSSFTHKAPLLSTDMRCYFGCNQGFKKEWDLRMHLKLKHKNEDKGEMERAYQDAEDEIALTRRSLSIYQCVLCPKQYSDISSFFGHIKNAHNMKWQDYKFQHGSCEIERGTFQCQICDRVVKYDKDCVNRHLQNLHNISWPMYLDRIRKLRRGERLENLPPVQILVCRICNATVKYLAVHVRQVHNITEGEYANLADTESTIGQCNQENDKLSKSATNAQLGLTTYWSPEKANVTADSSNEAMMNPSLGLKSERSIHPSKFEIKDKTNKSCSSCDIEFETRRLFIEHCTSVHKMKFKTATGETILAPGPNSLVHHQKIQHVSAIKQGVSPRNDRLSNISPHIPSFTAHTPQKRLRTNEEFCPEESNNIGSESRYHLSTIKQEYFSPRNARLSNISPHIPSFKAHTPQKRLRTNEQFCPEESSNIGSESRYHLSAIKQEYFSPRNARLSNISPHIPSFKAHTPQKRIRANEEFYPEESMNIGSESRYGRKIKRTSL